MCVQEIGSKRVEETNASEALPARRRRQLLLLLHDRVFCRATRDRDFIAGGEEDPLWFMSNRSSNSLEKVVTDTTVVLAKAAGGWDNDLAASAYMRGQPPAPHVL